MEKCELLDTRSLCPLEVASASQELPNDNRLKRVRRMADILNRGNDVRRSHEQAITISMGMTVHASRCTSQSDILGDREECSSSPKQGRQRPNFVSGSSSPGTNKT